MSTVSFQIIKGQSGFDQTYTQRFGISSWVYVWLFPISHGFAGMVTRGPSDSITHPSSHPAVVDVLFKLGQSHLHCGNIYPEGRWVKKESD